MSRSIKVRVAGKGKFLVMAYYRNGSVRCLSPALPLVAAYALAVRIASSTVSPY
jgi:hypothetical protein